jgi:hypothetical protein
MKLKLPESIYKNPELYFLTVMLHPERWSLLFCSPDDTDFIFFAEGQPAQMHDVFSSFKDCFFENEFFSMPFRKVFVVNHSANFTFIPDSIDAELYGREFLMYVSSEKGGVVLHHPVKGTGFLVLHRMPEAVYDFFLRSFADLQFIHHSAPLINCFAAKSRDDCDRQMFVNRQGQEMDIFCFSGGKLLLANTHYVRNLQDVLYLICFTWKQLKFDQLTDSVLLAGDTAENNITAQELRHYIKNVGLCPMPDLRSVNPLFVLASKEYVMS